MTNSRINTKIVPYNPSFDMGIFIKNAIISREKYKLQKYDTNLYKDFRDYDLYMQDINNIYFWNVYLGDDMCINYIKLIIKGESLENENWIIIWDMSVTKEEYKLEPFSYIIEHNEKNNICTHPIYIFSEIEAKRIYYKEIQDRIDQWMPDEEILWMCRHMLARFSPTVNDIVKSLFYWYSIWKIYN